MPIGRTLNLAPLTICRSMVPSDAVASLAKMAWYCVLRDMNTPLTFSISMEASTQPPSASDQRPRPVRNSTNVLAAPSGDRPNDLMMRSAFEDVHGLGECRRG